MNPDFYEPECHKTSNISTPFSCLQTPEEIHRENFLLANGDGEIRAFFMVPVLCAYLEIDCSGMTEPVRDNIANKFCDLSDADLAIFLRDFSSGGLMQHAAMESVGMSIDDFTF